MVETGERKRRKKDRTNEWTELKDWGEKEKRGAEKKSMKNNGNGGYAICLFPVLSPSAIAARATLISLVLVKLPSTHYAHEIAVVFIAAVVSCRLDAR